MANYEISVKSVEQIDNVASIRETIPAYPSVGALFGELTNYLAQKNVQPKGYCAAIWHDPGYKEKDVDAEVVFSVPDSLEGNERIKVKHLQALDKAAVVIHRGTYITLTNAHSAIHQWIKDNNYEISGPCREIYVKGGSEHENPNYVTEIQVPVTETTGKS